MQRLKLWENIQVMNKQYKKLLLVPPLSEAFQVNVSGWYNTRRPSDTICMTALLSPPINLIQVL